MKESTGLAFIACTILAWFGYRLYNKVQVESGAPASLPIERTLDQGSAGETSENQSDQPTPDWIQTRRSPRLVPVARASQGLRLYAGRDGETVLHQIPEGTSLTVLSREGSWLRVALPNGQVGYVRRREVDNTPPRDEASEAETATASNGNNLPPPAGRPAENENAYPDVNSPHAVREVSSDGTLVTLEDGSRWRVESANQSEAAQWQPNEGVIVRESTTTEDGYTLTNTDRTATIEARFLGFAR